MKTNIKIKIKILKVNKIKIIIIAINKSIIDFIKYSIIKLNIKKCLKYKKKDYYILILYLKKKLSKIKR